MIEKKAYAKINLVLEVLGRRNDGYHEVSTIMHAVGIFDQLTFMRGDRLSLECDNATIDAEANLVMRAALLLQRVAGITAGVTIYLRKGIPLAAGLGGGSSDAAATLSGLNCFWEAGLSRVDLINLGSSLGSDVPFFLGGSGCALATGRGEVIMPLPVVFKRWVVLLRPEVATPRNKTALLYSMLSERDYSNGAYVEKLAEELKADRLPLRRSYNTFERVANDAFPGLDAYRNLFIGAGAPYLAMTGSGPVLYTLVDSSVQATKIRNTLLQEGCDAHVAPLIAGEHSQAN